MMALYGTLLAAQYLILSDRSALWDADTISPQTEEIDSKGVEQSTIDFAQFNDKKVLLLVHGFNNTAQDAMQTYQQIRDRVGALKQPGGKELYDVIIGYFWPGYDKQLEYFSAEKNAKELAARMCLHLSLLALHAKSVDLMAHSMGNRLILDALQNLTQAQASTVIENYYSLAPAVDDKSIEKKQQYYNSTQRCKNMFVFHSSRDDVLKFLYTVVELEEALGYKGELDPKATPHNIQFIDCTAFVDSHSGYFTVDPLYAFIKNQQEKKIPSSNVAQNVKLLADGLVESIAK